MSDTSLAVWTGRPQASRRKVIAQIMVGGQDVTNAVFPHLQALNVILKMESISTASLDLDDRDGRLVIPGFGSPIDISLGWANEGTYKIFSGWVDSVECGFERKAGGRRMWVDCTGWVAGAAGKSPVNLSWGEGAPPGQPEGTTKIPLGKVLQDLAGRAGYKLNIGPGLGNIERDFWHTGTTSFHHYAAQLANELGIAFSISGGVASFADILKPGFAPDGTAMATILAVWGDNLIAYRVKPYVTRPQWQGFQGAAYDIAKSVWDRFSLPIGSIFGNATAFLQLPFPAPNKTVSDQRAHGQQAQAQFVSASGWVSINGEPSATPGGSVKVSGAREGVDGLWTVYEVHHTYDRSSGYVTRLAVRYPVAGDGTPQNGATFNQRWPAPGAMGNGS